MTTAQTPSGTPPPEAGQQPPPEEERHRSPWLWISLLLGVAVVALGVWGFSKSSDLDDANAKIDQQEQTGSEVVTTAKSAIDASDQQAQDAQKDAADANAEAQQAQQEAAAAKAKAADATDTTEQLQAQVDEAQADAKAAEAKAKGAADCAKAYISALGSLFEGEGSVQDKAAGVRKELESITADCKATLAG